MSGTLHLPIDGFQSLVARASAEFSDAGLANEDIVALLLRNDVGFLVAMTACGRSGLYAATINWQSHPDEISYVLRDCAASAILVDDDLLPKVLDIIPPTVTIYAVGRGLDRATIDSGILVRRAVRDWSARLLKQSPTEAPPRTTRSVITYTSGTTGKPKGVIRQPYPDKAAEAKHAETLGKVFGIDEGVRTLLCAPLYHSGPSAYARLAVRTLGTEGLIVVHARFEAERVLADIQDHRITHIWMVPTMFHRLLALPDEIRTAYDLSSLQWITVSAAHCPAETKKAMIDWFGPVIFEFYGTTETGPATVATSQDALERPGTVGRVLSGISLSIRNEEGEELPVGEIGEICCRNIHYPDFTYINRDDERHILDVASQIRTGDVGELDEDGFLFIRDRKKDMVIVGGVNIYPAEIESVLVQMPKVVDCAVLGLPHPEYGETLIAAVVLQSGVGTTEEDIKNYLANKIAKFKIPRHVFILSELPRHESGKLVKRRLRDELSVLLPEADRRTA